MNNKTINGMKCVLYLFGVLIVSFPVQAASFDCAKAGTKVEKMICDNPEISKLDEELNTAYKAALQDEKQAEAIRQAQKQWMKERNGCDDAECVKRAYEARLHRLSSASAQGGGDWPYRDIEGKNELLCRVLINRINHYERERPDTRCSTWDEIASYPKFTEPSWEELDPKTHEELLIKLMKYERGDYFQTLPKLEQQKRDSVYRNLVKDFIHSGGHLRVWRTKPALIYGGGHGTPNTSTEEQTFVQIGTEPEQTMLCVGTLHPPADWMSRTYVVMPDLSDLDSNIIPAKPGIANTNALLVNTNGLFMYEGKPILVGSQDVWRFSSGSLEHICHFQFIKGEK